MRSTYSGSFLNENKLRTHARGGKVSVQSVGWVTVHKYYEFVFCSLPLLWYEQRLVQTKLTAKLYTILYLLRSVNEFDRVAPLEAYPVPSAGPEATCSRNPLLAEPPLPVLSCYKHVLLH